MKVFETPEMEVIAFAVEDVITTSTTEPGQGDFGGGESGL